MAVVAGVGEAEHRAIDPAQARGLLTHDQHRPPKTIPDTRDLVAPDTAGRSIDHDDVAASGGGRTPRDLITPGHTVTEPREALGEFRPWSPAEADDENVESVHLQVPLSGHVSGRVDRAYISRTKQRPNCLPLSTPELLESAENHPPVA